MGITLTTGDPVEPASRKVRGAVAAVCGAVLAAVAVLGGLILAFAPVYAIDGSNGVNGTGLLVAVGGVGVVAGSARGAHRLLRRSRAGCSINAAVSFVFLVFAILEGAVILLLAVALLSSGQADTTALVRLALGAVSAVVFALTARWYIRRDRRLCRFLRRFRFTAATEVVGAVVAGWVGASWRIVTLDDDVVAPMGASRRNRAISWSVALFGLVVMPGAVIYCAAVLKLDFGTSAGVPALVITFLGIIAGVVGATSAWRARRQAMVVVNRPEHVPASSPAPCAPGATSWPRNADVRQRPARYCRPNGEDRHGHAHVLRRQRVRAAHPGRAAAARVRGRGPGR